MSPGGAIFVPSPPKTGTNFRHPRPPIVERLFNRNSDTCFQGKSPLNGAEAQGMVSSVLIGRIDKTRGHKL